MKKSNKHHKSEATEMQATNVREILKNLKGARYPSYNSLAVDMARILTEEKKLRDKNAKPVSRITLYRSPYKEILKAFLMGRLEDLNSVPKKNDQRANELEISNLRAEVSRLTKYIQALEGLREDLELPNEVGLKIKSDQIRCNQLCFIIQSILSNFDEFLAVNVKGELIDVAFNRVIVTAENMKPYTNFINVKVRDIKDA